MTADLGENCLGRVGTYPTETSCGLHGNGSARLELIGNIIKSNLHERVETLGGGSWVILESTQTANRLLGHLEVFLLELGGGATVIELVDVDSRSSATGVDHKNILNNGFVLGIGLGASIGTVRAVCRGLAIVIGRATAAAMVCYCTN